MWLGVAAYGGIVLSIAALLLLILGFGQVGKCSAVDNTWEACEFRTDMLASLIFFPPMGSIVAAGIALALKRQPGEKGKWLAASAFLVAPLLLAVLIFGALNLGIR
jgi:hypothetical protein